jgi:hypothetical protein
VSVTHCLIYPPDAEAKRAAELAAAKATAPVPAATVLQSAKVGVLFADGAGTDTSSSESTSLAAPAAAMNSPHKRDAEHRAKVDEAKRKVAEAKVCVCCACDDVTFT